MLFYGLISKRLLFSKTDVMKTLKYFLTRSIFITLKYFLFENIKPFWIPVPVDACVLIFIKVNGRREEISTFCENFVKYYSLTNFCLCINNINCWLITTKLMEMCGILIICMWEKKSAYLILNIKWSLDKKFSSIDRLIKLVKAAFIRKH